MRKLLRGLGWTLLGIVIILIAVPVLVYIPAVQDAAVDIATRKLSETTGMKISLEQLRLRFPLKLSLRGASVIEASGDTMLTARSAAVDVKLLPLLHGDIEIKGLDLDSATYQLGNADSLLWLRARIDRASVAATDMNFKKGRIALSSGDVDGIDVWLRMLEDTTAAPVDTTASTPLLITAGRLTVSRLTYRMQMLPTIDSLGCRVDRMELRDGTVDMASKSIFGHSLSVDSVSAAYIYPALAANPASEAPADTIVTPDSEMWTIRADQLRLTGRSGLYAERGAIPAPGLDMAYLSVSDIDIRVDSFYNRGTSIRVPITRLSATERCGLQLLASGIFSMDSGLMRAERFDVATLRSQLSLSAAMGIGDLTSDPDLPLSLNAKGIIDPSEIALAYPDMKAMLAPLRPLSLSAAIDGTAAALVVDHIQMRMADMMSLRADGRIVSPFDPDHLGGSMSLAGHLASVSDRQFPFLPIKRLPAITIDGDISYFPGRAEGKVDLTAGHGEVVGAGRWTARAKSYNATLHLDRFPVDAFMPELGVGDVTASLTVDGRGYNPMDPGTTIDASVDLISARYLKETYSDISLTATLHDGNARGHLNSTNPAADATAEFDALLHGDSVTWDFTAEVRRLDLRALGMADSLCQGTLDLASKGSCTLSNMGIDASARVSNLAWSLPGSDITTVHPIDLNLRSADSLLDASLVNGDLALRLHSTIPVIGFADSLSLGAAEAMRSADSMRIDVRAIQSALPPIDMTLVMGRDNAVARYLRSGSDMDFRTISAGLHNDSVINLSARLIGFATGSTRTDTIDFSAIQHGEYLAYRAAMNNRPGTFDDFAHVALNGFAGYNRLSAYITQSNIKGQKGFNIGLGAVLKDSIATVKFVPFNPTIAYKPWTLNKDNFISYDLADRHLDANLQLSGDNSFIRIFTEHPVAETDSGGVHIHNHAMHQEDLVLQISQVHLQDWLAINPFAPPVKGDLSADMRFRYENNVLTGRGSVGLTDLFYGRDRVGTFDLDVDVATTPGGQLSADVALMVDSVKTITARGILNDSTARNPFLLDFDMIRFPLRVVNPFIPQGMASLSGMLNGKMEITGTMAHPVFNGFIDFDSTAVKVKMLGTSFTFSEEEIPVDSGVVTFSDFTIMGANSNPLKVNGRVDARDLTNLALDLSLAAKDIQIVNSNRARGGADIYGKAYLDLDATAKGDMKYLNVDADVSILPATNVTYVVSAIQETLTSQTDEDMVHFVVFSDTTADMQADSIVSSSMALALNARLHLLQGCTINVDLSEGSANKAHIQPQGDLVYTMNEFAGQRLTGRLNIDEGYVRYTPPFLSEKNFVFQEGSYVAFSGDILNPTVNVKAVDQVKANVTQEGQNSRLVNFDISLSLTNTLQDLNVAFDLATDDDITVQNELASMSAEQRANQAMNMLLYNVYTGAGTRGNANLSGNQLYAFLTSRLNSWAANNIRGVDISFGIDQYDKTYAGSTTTATSYSYRVSKSFFNDRFKIVVGGNYSTDADTDENFSQNLINDISFEYLLNQSGSMYVKIFRHTGYESILEGEITQTGVGFVLKRKLNSLWELFGLRRERH